MSSAQLEQFINKLLTPPVFTVPSRLRFEHHEARAITRADLSDDVHGINASLELIPAPAVAAGQPDQSPRRAAFLVLKPDHESQ